MTRASACIRVAVPGLSRTTGRAKMPCLRCYTTAKTARRARQSGRTSASRATTSTRSACSVGRSGLAHRRLTQAERCPIKECPTFASVVRGSTCSDAEWLIRPLADDPLIPNTGTEGGISNLRGAKAMVGQRSLSGIDGDLDEFLRLVGHAVRRPEVNAGREAVASWLQRWLGVELALVGRSGTVEASTAGFPAEVPELLRPMVRRVAHGHIACAVSRAGTFQVLVEPVGSRPPRPVLLVVSPEPLPFDTRSRIAYAGNLMAALNRAGKAEQTSLAYHRKAHQVRLAVFMALMAGDVTLGRRMTAGNVPALLASKRLRLYLLRCAPAERDRIVQAYQDPSGYHGRGLMVRCPVYDHHVICLCEDEVEDTAEDERRGQQRCGTGTPRPRGVPGVPGVPGVLYRLVEEQTRYLLGVSQPHPLADTAQAYEQARHALAAAARGCRRVVVFGGHLPLAKVLPTQTALPWARSLLAPLADAPDLTMAVARLALLFPRSGVARLLGVSRNTVTAHVRRVEQALGMDLNSVGAQAALALALSIASPDHARAPDSATPPTLAPALRTEEVIAWATAFLRPLERHEHRLDLWATLREWIASNTDAQRAARSLGISRGTVTAHLHTAQRLLKLDLLSGGPGVHALLHALHITGRIPPPPCLR